MCCYENVQKKMDPMEGSLQVKQWYNNQVSTVVWEYQDVLWTTRKDSWANINDEISTLRMRSLDGDRLMQFDEEKITLYLDPLQPD